jgi:FKBP-type peptidyl-prolyl cis-trans isomerase FkpA
MALSTVFAACESPTSPSSAPFSQTDLRLGTGAPAANGNVLTVHYTGWLYNPAQPDQKGAQFDSSVGGTPFSFALGTGSVISGWDVGLVGIRLGGARRLVIPPSLAYGGSRTGPIPPNATLVFEIELVELVTGSS